ncbi:uncharacterized protein EV422DRAFT_513207, partial [Fimicolochytrium jonesii]|uniref:uncharacterized protein n=1 Tax=Fimicolochytrium jonesii TaxID=1396493 RepID=UPI0022FEB70A
MNGWEVFFFGILLFRCRRISGFTIHTYRHDIACSLRQAIRGGCDMLRGIQKRRFSVPTSIRPLDCDSVLKKKFHLVGI